MWDIYEKVQVKLGFRRFTSVGVERIGIPIFYGLTIPKNAPNPELGLEFMKFVLSEGGRVCSKTNIDLYSLWLWII